MSRPTSAEGSVIWVRTLDGRQVWPDDEGLSDEARSRVIELLRKASTPPSASPPPVRPDAESPRRRPWRKG